MTHKLHSCEAENCFVCDGALSLCEVCGGAEGAMPTHCPGSRIDGSLLDQIQRGAFDYADGRWIEKRQADDAQISPANNWIIATVAGRTFYAEVAPNSEDGDQHP